MTAPEQDGLFGATVTNGAYGRSTSYDLGSYDEASPPRSRGPGPRPPTTGPRDAGAPAWWWREGEAFVLAQVASGRTVSTDDLHEHFLGEPSATGAAFGGLFARLSSAGRIVEVGWARSQRPAARGRRVVVWGRGSS